MLAAQLMEAGTHCPADLNQASAEQLAGYWLTDPNVQNHLAHVSLLPSTIYFGTDDEAKDINHELYFAALRLYAQAKALYPNLEHAFELLEAFESSKEADLAYLNDGKAIAGYMLGWHPGGNPSIKNRIFAICMNADFDVLNQAIFYYDQVYGNS